MQVWKGLGLNGDDVLKYRYNGDFSKFDVKPKVVYVGDGQTGKDIAKGLEQRLFENRGGLENTSNKQTNPVGKGNGRRDTYLQAIDDYMKQNPCIK